MEKLNKLSLPATILIASIILGGFYYLSETKKQESIEKQQQIELQAKSETEKANLLAKQTQDNIEYSAKQKSACLSIYETEGKKWNNVNGWRYSDVDDVCYIQYKETTKKTRARCDADWKGDDGKVASYFFTNYALCLDGLFEKTF